MSRPPASCLESHKSEYTALHGSRPWNATRHQRGSARRTCGCPSKPSKTQNSVANIFSSAASNTLPYFLHCFHPKVCKVFKVNFQSCTLHLFAFRLLSASDKFIDPFFFPGRGLPMQSLDLQPPRGKAEMRTLGASLALKE